jgi:glycosyltransferase involved in cell wall biosynthesis
MNLLLFSETSYPRHPGGGGKCAHLIAAGLAARRHQVTLLSLTSDPTVREKIDGVDVHRVQLKRPSGAGRRRPEFDAARSILLHLERHIALDRIDAVHDIGGFLSFFYPVELQLRQRHGIPFVVHFEFLSAAFELSVGGAVDPFSPSILSMEAAVEDRVQCFPVRMADRIICPSFEEAAFVHRLYRPQPSSVAVIPNPVDIDAIGDQPTPRIRERLAPGGEQLVLFGGRVDNPMKGGDVLRRAFERILSTRPNVRLVILGYTARAGDVFRGLESHITPIDWVAGSREVAQILKATDVVVVPSRYEPFGMMCSEAMAAGVPVVVTAVGGLREMVTDGFNGFQLRERDPENRAIELAHHVERILADRALAHRLGANGRAFARRHFGMDTVAARIEEVYRSLPPVAARPVTAPALTVGDRARYVEMLDQVLPAEAANPGEEILHSLQSSIDQRCGRCTRQRLAQEALMYIGARTLMTPAWELESICPLGLLQRDALQAIYQRRLRR